LGACALPGTVAVRFQVLTIQPPCKHVPSRATASRHDSCVPIPSPRRVTPKTAHLERWTSRAAAAFRALRTRARSEEGFTIIEVIVSAAMVALIAGGIMTGLDATQRTAADLRSRSQAEDLAHQDQERMQGMSVLQLSGLDQTRPVVLDGTTYTVHSTGQFLSSSGQGQTCTESKADYVKVISDVWWKAGTLTGSQSKPIRVQSIVSPPTGGTLLVRVNDNRPVGQSGVRVQALQGASGDNLSATTDASGCVSFAGINLGTYLVIASKTGWVDPNGSTTAVGGITTSTADTKTLDLTYAQGGMVRANFTAGGITGGTGESPTISWQGGTMTGMKSMPATTGSGSTPIGGTLPTPTSSLTTPLLFPFYNAGSTASNYDVWAGRCAADKPTVPTKGTAAENLTTPVTVPLPSMRVAVTYQQNTGLPAPVKPDNVRVKDACNDIWFPTLRATPDPVNGALASPGQPFGTYKWVCADYDPPGGGVNPKHAFLANVANTNLLIPKAVPLNVKFTTSGASANGLCATATDLP
jgi:type II secretory pathway pseudopilin PulG